MDLLSDYDYELPEELIAQLPLEDRSASRLLHLDRATGSVSHRRFLDCIDLLERGDTLVLNDTRVSALRLFGQKETGAQVEVFLMRPTESGCYECLLRPAKRLPPGTVIRFAQGLEATVLEPISDEVRHVRFNTDDFEVVRQQGEAPLPPYIRAKLPNQERYQTVYSQSLGSAAAPTAGLHFTDEVLGALTSKGIEIARVTLHVGLDTFRPVQVENADDHMMHGEYCQVSEETADRVNSTRGRVIAVGTTSVRTLESFSIGPKKLAPGTMSSRIFIRPGYQFKTVDGMFTNFHMPRTTMMLMLAAMTGRQSLMRAYAEAVSNRYRFLSFGDSMLIT